MSNEPIKLAACPFCGEKPTHHAIEPHTHALSVGDFRMPDHPGSHVIECGCGAGLLAGTFEEVAAMWNRRPTPPEAQAGAGVEVTNNDAIGHIDEEGRVFIYSAAPKGVLLFTAAPKAVAQGWRLVPERPTRDMVGAGMRKMFDEKRYTAAWDDVVELMYCTMLDAAPLPASPSEEEKA